MATNITIKRSEIGGMISASGSAKADPSYTGSFTVGGVDASGNAVTVVFTFADESSQS